MALGKTGRRAIVAASIGNAFEWYDFIVFGFLSVIVAKQFFPSSDPTTSLLLTTGTFGTAFLVRPLGGILIGIYADRAGRKAALSLVMALMTIASLITALTPSYETIGMAAPLLIVIARLLQGLSAGGEFGSATAMLIEYAPPRQRGFYGSWQFFGQFVAAVVAAVMGWLVTRQLPASFVAGWGWRLPFLFGVLIGPIGFYIRTRIEEPPAFRHAARAQEAPVGGALGAVWRDYRPELMIALGLVTFGTVAQYVLNLYLPIYAVRELKLPVDTPFVILTITGVTRMILMPFFGLLSDRIGRKPVMTAGMALYVLTLYPLFTWVLAAPSLPRLLAVEMVFSLLMAASVGPSATALAELFPTRFRGTGLALAYNVATTLFGGFSPFAMTWLIEHTGDKAMPAYYVTAAALVGLAAIWPMKDRASQDSLEDRALSGMVPLEH